MDCNGTGLVHKSSQDYPFLLKEIQNPPSEIYVLGNLPEEPPAAGPRIAVVGTRKATMEGRQIAREIAEKLTRAGAIIVSGLAMGIDTAGHEGALAGGGRTIAVLARGLDEIYPRQNENLAKRIIERNGAIISEYPPGTPPLPKQFLERNRIISGLSTAVVIIEAPEESGSLVTARLAGEQGREVFVLPGPAGHPNYRGSHKLIRDGARLASSAEDILEDLDLEAPAPETKILQDTGDYGQSLIVKTIQEAGRPLNVDKIIELTKLEPRIVNQSLTLLVIQKMIKETGKGYTL